MTLPWFEYAGETAPEIVALKTTHRIDSLLCALESGIQRKRDEDGADLTDEEGLFLAVMALDRDVNNGGYDQFFGNVPWFAPVIASSLSRIGCVETLAITERALAAFALPEITEEAVTNALFEEDENEARDEALEECDNAFYQVFEIEQKLFAFAEENLHAFRLPKVSMNSPSR